MVDLSKNRQYVDSYVGLRNCFVTELASKIVTSETTLAWMDTGAGDILCEVEGDQVVAALVVYGTMEVAVFSSKPRMGDALLAEADAVAKSKGYEQLWAWTMPGNVRAEKLFERNGYGWDGSSECYMKHTQWMNDTALRFPRMVVLSFTYVCNANCPNCPYNNSAIRGDVTFCGEDIAFAHKFANIGTRSIADIWQGPEFQQIRNAHIKQRGHPEMCRLCPDWKYRTWDRGYFKLREYARNNITA